MRYRLARERYRAIRLPFLRVSSRLVDMQMASLPLWWRPHFEQAKVPLCSDIVLGQHFPID